MSYFVGIDLGGTNIKAGIVDDKGKIVFKLSRPTRGERGHMPVIKDMAKLVFEMLEIKRIPIEDISCIGIGCPGTINKDEGKVEFSNNLAWYDVSIAQCMENLTGKRIFLENDANAAAFGEYVAGSLREVDSALFITLGTGVGSGIILNGRIFSGFNGMGGELGHMVICEGGRSCTCGRKGCLEAYASSTALAAMAREKMKEDKVSVLWKLCSEKTDKVNGAMVFKAKNMGDGAAAEVVEAYVNYLSSGIVSAVNILQPQVVAIGGGVAGSADEIIPIINRRLGEEVFSRHYGRQTVVRAAELGNDAGIVGAAMLWKNK